MGEGAAGAGRAAGRDHPGGLAARSTPGSRRARDSDFAAFLPHLERNVELRRRYADCFDGFEGFEHPYDPLLDDFEPGMTTPEMAAVLGELRDGVRPLIAAGRRAAGTPSTTPACTATSRSTPRTPLAREVVAELPLQEDAWRLDPTVHPFATAISPADIRITTRFEPELLRHRASGR